MTRCAGDEMVTAAGTMYSQVYQKFSAPTLGYDKQGRILRSLSWLWGVTARHLHNCCWKTYVAGRGSDTPRMEHEREAANYISFLFLCIHERRTTQGYNRYRTDRNSVILSNYYHHQSHQIKETNSNIRKRGTQGYKEPKTDMNSFITRMYNPHHNIQSTNGTNGSGRRKGSRQTMMRSEPHEGEMHVTNITPGTAKGRGGVGSAGSCLHV